METPFFRFIYSGELTVAASYESTDKIETSSYYPMTLIMFVEEGWKYVSIEGEEEQDFGPGSYFMIRKFSEGALYNRLSNNGITKSYGFALSDDYIRKIINEVQIPHNLPPIKSRVTRLVVNEQLTKLMQFVQASVNKGAELDSQTLEDKTKEAVKAILETNPSLGAVFREYTLAQRIDLTEFMNMSYLLRMPLSKFANQSGRSLSTFHRDFKMIFGETPHRWIMRKRLIHANGLLKEQMVKPSDVYIQVGFEDLAHFSRAFKKEFGYPPSRAFGKT